MVLNLSYPAVSHIYNLTPTPATLTLLNLKSTPMVVKYISLKESSQKRRRSEDLPTPLLPMITILKKCYSIIIIYFFFLSITYKKQFTRTVTLPMHRCNVHLGLFHRTYSNHGGSSCNQQIMHYLTISSSRGHWGHPPTWMLLKPHSTGLHWRQSIEVLQI